MTKEETQNLVDKIYGDFCKEIGDLNIQASSNVITVVGELTRALKRVCNNNGGTAIIVDGVKYTKDD